MAELKSSSSLSLRVCVSFAAILAPFILLSKGIFGSFLFTFSVPLIWQFGFLGKSIYSLGLRRDFLRSSLIAGLISGVILGLLGGSILKLLGITGYIFTGGQTLRISIGAFPAEFSLQNELGYRLLNMSATPAGIFVYLLFSVLVIGLGEELFWRGFVLKKIFNHAPMHAAIWITAILFAAIHFYIFAVLPFAAGVIFLAIIAIAGACWGYLFMFFNNLWPVAISHGIAAFIIWKYYFF